MQRGVGRLLLLSRKGPQSEAAQTLLRDLEIGGVAVLAPTCDVGDEKSLLASLDHCDTVSYPIKGCIHGAMALKVSSLASVSQKHSDPDISRIRFSIK